MKEPLILLTNDDGVHSPGLLAAAQAVHDLGALVIVAPKRQQSSMGRSLPAATSGALLAETITVNGDRVLAYSIPGSPAQAVLYAITDLLSGAIGGRRSQQSRLPDLVISGINYGENLGASTTISGTVGAALQAADAGIPALAVSMETVFAAHNDSQFKAAVDWTAARHFTRYFAQRLLDSQFLAETGKRQLLPDVDALKIDVPASATPQTPWRLTRQSRQPYYWPLPMRRQDPSQPHPLDYEVRIDHARLESDSDIYAFVVDRVVSVTPLSLELTSRVDMALLGGLLQA